MGRWSRQLAVAVVRRLAEPAGLRWLDVGCGTGALSAAILEGAAPASVTGVDPSVEFVTSACEEMVDGRAVFKVAGAGALPLNDASVDVVVSGLVLNFVPDAVAALGEMTRVVVPDGLVAAYVWDYGDGMQMLRYFWDAAKEHDAAAAELDEAVRFPLCQKGGLKKFFVAAGLQNVQEFAVSITMRFNDFDDFWLPFLGAQGPGPSYVAGLTTAAQDELRSRLQFMLPVQQNESIHLTARAWAATGSAPSV